MPSLFLSVLSHSIDQLRISSPPLKHLLFFSFNFFFKASAFCCLETEVYCLICALPCTWELKKKKKSQNFV